jgi:hypothetical protein
MEIFLWLRCVYRNKCSYYGLILLYLGVIGALCISDPDIREHLSVMQTAAGAIVSLCTIGFGSILFVVTACGYSTMLAYRTACMQHEEHRRSFQEFLFRKKDYCVEVGWLMAAEDLGYMGGRE